MGVNATWGIYQLMIVVHRETDMEIGEQLMQTVIDSVTSGSPRARRVPHARPQSEAEGRGDPRALRLARHPYGTEAINGRLDTSAAPPSASATSRTTSPDRCSSPEDSGEGVVLAPFGWSQIRVGPAAE